MHRIHLTIFRSSTLSVMSKRPLLEWLCSIVQLNSKPISCQTNTPKSCKIGSKTILNRGIQQLMDRMLYQLLIMQQMPFMKDHRPFKQNCIEFREAKSNATIWLMMTIMSLCWELVFITIWVWHQMDLCRPTLMRWCSHCKLCLGLEKVSKTHSDNRFHL